MSAQHTAGQWKFLKNGMLVTQDETQIIGTFHADRSNDDDNRELIAAAPELLAALERIMSYAYTGAMVNDVDPNEQPQFIAARAAIAKAKGE